MSTSLQYGESEPLFYLGDLPVRFITLLVALRCAAVIAGSLLEAAGYGGWVNYLEYSSNGVAHGQIWRLVSYAFVSPADIYFLVEMLMLYYFGREVENGLGWQRFGILYAGLVIVGPMLLQAFGYAGIPQRAIGAREVDFAIFAAFVAMHPGAQFFFGMAARWVFVALLAIFSLQLLATHQPPQLLVLISTSFLAISMMRRAGFEEPLFGLSIQWSLPSFRKQKSPFSVVSGGLSSASRSQKNSPKPSGSSPEEEMDRLLEKISSHGISSLSVKERASLEEARQAMLQRDGRNSR